jgi:hypothetical protein
VGGGDGDDVFGVEKDPEGVAGDTCYFGVPFFVGAGGVAFLEEFVGFVGLVWVGEELEEGCACFFGWSGG